MVVFVDIFEGCLFENNVKEEESRVERGIEGLMSFLEFWVFIICIEKFFF